MIRKVSYSILCFAIMGCSTSTNIVPTKEVKVDSVKVNQVNVFDLGKKGSSVKANFNLGKEKSPFGIKTETNADLVGTIDCVKVYLHSMDNTLLYTKPTLLDRTTFGISRDLPVSGSTLSLTFSGLQPNKDYYVAAQAYSNTSSCADFSNSVNETSVDGTSSNTATGGTSGTVGIVYTPSEDNSSEEFINVNSSGIVDVMNDQNDGFNTFGDNVDIKIQLRKPTNASVTGDVDITNGDSPDAENITVTP